MTLPARPSAPPVIRAINEGDVEALYTLMCELAEHEGQRAFLTVTPEQLTSSGFGAAPKWRGFIAEIGGRAAGYATYTDDFHVWSGTSRINLDDVYVRPACRGSGLGESLMRRVFDDASRRGARVSWMVQQENARAIAFYKRLGAHYFVTGRCAWRSPAENADRSA